MSEASKGGKLKFEWTDKEGYTQNSDTYYTFSYYLPYIYTIYIM